jgi:hypothetical protein
VVHVPDGSVSAGADDRAGAQRAHLVHAVGVAVHDQGARAHGYAEGGGRGGQ